MEYKPIIMIIRDGWGYRKEKEFNATEIGENPYTKMLMKTYPNILLDASGEAVGLPKGYQGNSEVGHMTIGAGKIFFQSLPRINKSIESGDFFKNPVFLNAIKNCKDKKSTFHIIGLLQKEGVHAHMDHCIALIELCKREGIKNVLIHVISDGRDSSVDQTLKNIIELESIMKNKGIGKIATISGRYYAMDRDKKWDRTKLAYECIVNGKTEITFKNPEESIKDSYTKGKTDEFVEPRKLIGYEGVEDNDSVVFFNFRTDRTRQLTMSLIEDNFEGWERKAKNIFFVAMTEFYSPMNKKGHVAFPTEPVINLLGEVLSKNGINQLRISETEKYAHVTFFFNGQMEKAFEKEERILIPSPKISTYDLKPEMSVYELGDKIVEEIKKKKYDVIITNLVNADMVGHTGVWESILKAVKAVDDNVKKITKETLKQNGVVLILGDHGCIEEKTPELKTSHTKNKIPFILVSKDPKLKSIKLIENRGLQDVAPTVLKLLNIKKPEEMTGIPLF
ncbi:MAG: 2,3-bisphosphoglycerate-independent phosphoglycerate mutase [Candidatus Micrarchaeaceae archaeon]